MGDGRLERGEVWKRLGAPTEQIGSVNDPRTRDEHGVRWNEKWVYRDPEERGFDRVVLWNRYDLLGVFRVGADGRVEPEPLPEA